MRYIARFVWTEGSAAFDRAQGRWIPDTHGVAIQHGPRWPFLYFQDFLEEGKPIYRIAVPRDI